MLDWLPTARLRPVVSILGLSGLLALAACGGGNGAPNNPYNPTPGTPALQLAPPALTAYSGVPVTITITSGVSPFTAFTNNAAALPVTQNVAGNTIVLLPNNVSADTVVTLTVKDSAGQTTTAAVTVKASPLFNSFTFSPSGADCGRGADDGGSRWLPSGCWPSCSCGTRSPCSDRPRARPASRSCAFRAGTSTSSRTDRPVRPRWCSCTVWAARRLGGSR